MGALQDLIKVIETIRQRIKEHGDSVGKDETRTRQALIDPLLTTLGWDVTDPALVTLEYASGGGRADYALLGPSRPVAVVEAKRLLRPLDDKHIRQVLNYANAEGIKYMVVTNGDEWKMYDVFKNTPVSDRLLMQLEISVNPPHESAIQSLYLWNPNLSSATQPVAPVTPIVVPLQQVTKRKKSVPPVTPPADPDIPADTEWIALNDTKLQVGGKGKGWLTCKYVRFNGNKSIPVSTWSDLLMKTVDSLLVKPGRLTSAHCPRYSISSKKTIS